MKGSRDLRHSRQSFSSYNSLLFSKFSQFYDKSMSLRMLEEFFFWKVLYILCNRIKRFRHVDLLDLYCIHIFKINRDVGRQNSYISKWAVSKYAPVLSGIPSNIIREKLI